MQEKTMPDQVGHDGRGRSGMTEGMVGRDGAVNRAGRAGRVYAKSAFGVVLGVNAEGEMAVFGQKGAAFTRGGPCGAVFL